MIFHKSLLPISIAALLVGACSPAEYQVNPPSVEEEVQAIPEAEQAGYMRILGDLRWDQLTSKEEWMARFPECLTDRNSTTKKVNDDSVFNIGHRKCENFVAGGVPLNPGLVKFGDNAGTKSKTMTTDVYFSFFNVSQHRAVKATLAEKYPGTSDGHCSKYTCWVLENARWWSDSHIIARPTPYTVSLLDQVKIDASDF